MDFSKRIGRLSPDGIFELEGYYVWCGTMTRDADGLYYLFFSFWETKARYAFGITPILLFMTAYSLYETGQFAKSKLCRK